MITAIVWHSLACIFWNYEQQWAQSYWAIRQPVFSSIQQTQQECLRRKVSQEHLLILSNTIDMMTDIQRWGRKIAMNTPNILSLFLRLCLASCFPCSLPFSLTSARSGTFDGRSGPNPHDVNFISIFHFAFGSRALRGTNLKIGLTRSLYKRHNIWFPIDYG